METIYLARDNNIAYRLEAPRGKPISLEPVTKIDFKIGSTVITSANAENDPIRWSQPDYEIGEIRIKIGTEEGLTAKSTSQVAYLIVYDPSNPNGYIWGKVNVMILGGI